MIKKTLQSWIFIAHLIFWSAHWSLAFLGFENLSWNGFSTENNLLYIAFTYGILSNMLLFYWQYFFTVPYFFIKNEVSKFLLSTILFFIFVSSIEGYLNYHYTVTNNVLDEPFTFFEFFVIWLFPDFIFNVFYTFLGFLFRFPLEYFKSEKMKHELLKETHNSELKYLKAQLNPHFLFNGINSIYHLIGKNSTLAKNTLLQFSNLLRYQLYESGTQKIALKKELDYISQYIEIEKIRKGGDITLKYDISNENKQQQIAPLLLIPFIENAFKHLSDYDDPEENTVSILIKEVEGALICKIENTFDTLENTKSVGGIGLKNVQRRLALLYPDQYSLQSFKDGNIYKVSLKIYFK
ncbi:sensor histidine kinase [Flavivirga algicola]|uniref:Histidine kinase n=1 Tax=Flavivirga algicola TaxID=2729136 RepID=A0ABX1RYH1_9FLAO|nr:histidine kinase [Flavivirga algicola]NMH87259.1 histidine kinase [Flavivirga algicola]